MNSVFLEFKVAPTNIVRYESIYPNSRNNDGEDFTRPRSGGDIVNDSKWNQEKEMRRAARRQSTGPVESENDQQNSIVHEVSNSSGNAKESNSGLPQQVVAKDVPAYTIVVDTQSDERQVTSSTTDRNFPARKSSPNSDSNYSFTEFFEGDKPSTVDSPLATTPKEVNAMEQKNVNADYIAIADRTESNATNVSSSGQQGPDNSKSPVQSEARILLSKDNSKILINEKGSGFLREMSKKFNLRVRLEWQSVGNLLTICGTEPDQNGFHGELTKFLGEVSQERYNNLPRLPSNKKLLIETINSAFNCLKQDLGNVYALQKRSESDTGFKDTRDARKARKNLNISLFGQAGLREGKRRLQQLKDSLALIKSQDAPLGEDDTRLMEENYQYIFTSYKHKNYKELLYQYRMWQRHSAPPSEPASTTAACSSAAENII